MLQKFVKTLRPYSQTLVNTGLKRLKGVKTLLRPLRLLQKKEYIHYVYTLKCLLNFHFLKTFNYAVNTHLLIIPFV